MSISIKSVTTAPFELKVSKEPMIVASAILNSTRFTSRTELIFFLTFLGRPLRAKAILLLDLQKTPKLGFSLKLHSSRWDIFYTLLVFAINNKSYVFLYRFTHGFVYGT